MEHPNNSTDLVSFLTPAFRIRVEMRERNAGYHVATTRLYTR